MDNKTDVKLEAPPSDDDFSNEKALFMNKTTSGNDNIKVEANVSDVNLQNERHCVSKNIESDTRTSNYNFELESRISIKEEPITELQSVEYVNCLSDREIETVTKTEIGESESTSVADISQVNEFKGSNGEKNETADELPSSKSSRLTTEDGSLCTFADASDFKAASGKNDEEISSRLIYNPVYDTECFESVENVDDQLLNKHICEKSFSNKQTLKRHSLWHVQQKPYKCEHCEKCFKKKSNLKAHTLIHSGAKPYKCEHCETYFTQKSNLKAHKLVHSGTKPYKCEHCEKCFTQKAHLNAHSLIHSGAKPYKCEHCEAYFTQKSNLKAHILVHSGTKPYQCEHCEKCFTQKSDLNRHTLLHTGLKPYKCKHCEKCFRQKSSLNRHILFRHKTI